MVLKEHLKLQGLKKNLLDIYRKNKEKIFDILLFGSVLKGKENVEDVDVAVIFKDKEDINILNSIKNVSKEVHVDFLFLTELYKQSLWKTLIREGYSIVYKKKLSSVFDFQSYGLYVYDLTGLGSRKSRFSQVLSGYKAESVLDKVKGIILRPGVIMVPIEHVEYFRTFLETWNVKYKLKYIFVE